MGLTIGLNQWEDNIYLFEETDVLQGGPAGVDNVPLNQLANRTAWLKNQLGLITNLEDEVILTANAPIGANLQSHLIVAFAAGANILLTLDDPHTFKHGAIIPIAAFCNPGFVVSVTAPGFPIMNPVDGVVTTMHMHHNEQLELVALTDHWYIKNARGNFYCVGEEVKARKQLLNTLTLKGQLVNRASYPRLWAYVQGLTMWQEVTDETNWWNNGNTYRGLFSLGDGVSNFRLPDERGTFDRMLDLGRGLDTDRIHNFPGGYEDDQFKAHDHGLPVEGGGNTDMQSVVSNANADEKLSRSSLTTKEGGSETRSKNTAKYNLIKF